MWVEMDRLYWLTPVSQNLCPLPWNLHPNTEITAKLKEKVRTSSKCTQNNAFTTIKLEIQIICWITHKENNSLSLLKMVSLTDDRFDSSKMSAKQCSV